MKKYFAFLIILFSVSAFASNDMSEPLAAYKLDNKWYIIDHEGKAKFNPIDLVYVSGYSEGFYKIYIEADGAKFWGFMNQNGEVAVPACDEIRFFKNGMAMIADVVDKESELLLFGFINKDGKMVVPKKYLDATEFSEGLAWVMNHDERGYVDTNGRMVLPWDTTGFGSSFSEGLAVMTNKNDRFGYIDKQGKTVIPFIYDEVTPFINGLARVNILGKWGFINKKGDLVIPADYVFSHDFVDGFCFVGVPLKNASEYKPQWGIINQGGGIVVEFKYDDVRDFNKGLGAVMEDGKWKVIDYMGNQIIDKKFDNIESFRNNLAWSEIDGRFGFIDPTGDFAVELPSEAELVVDLRLNKRVK